MAVEPGEDLAGGGMVEGRVTLAQAGAAVAEAVAAAVLEGEQITADPDRQFLAEHLGGGAVESRAIFISVAEPVAVDERQSRNAAQHRLRGEVDAVSREMLADRRRPAGESAQVQMLRHARAVVDRIIVPEERLAAEQGGDAGEMARRIFLADHLFAGPHDVD